jgi:transcription elongation factor Elf1
MREKETLTPTKFERLMKQLSAVFRKKLDDEVMGTYYSAFREEDARIFSKAVANIINHREDGSFPTIAEIHKEIREIKENLTQRKKVYPCFYCGGTGVVIVKAGPPNEKYEVALRCVCKNARRFSPSIRQATKEEILKHLNSLPVIEKVVMECRNCGKMYEVKIHSKFDVSKIASRMSLCWECYVEEGVKRGIFAERG